ncbi:YDG domain-containing protein, partial [Halopseudomonas sp. Lyrl_26]|uniref:YDG domain-containing protein n=1 Tax=Halopseudomonas sp. Lyrl_26 TaxID=3110923 RepID=UPI003F8090DC
SNRFTGTFDGLGHVISDLFIDRGTTNYVGLFGHTDTATLRHVGLENSDITGQSGVGGLVGFQRDGTISQSYATGVVTGHEWVGSLVGLQNDASISQSYAAGAVNGTGFVGGLVGAQSGGSISQAYASGAVNGNYAVGGLVGFQWNGGISHQSYATGAVNGNSSVGGLVGYQADGTITNSFYATTNSDNNSITGDHTHSDYGTGRTLAELMNRDTFTGWDIDSEGGTSSVWRIYESHSTPLLRSFLTALTVTVDDDTVTYNGAEQTGNGGWSADVLYDSNLLLGSTDVTGGGRNAGEHTLSLVGLHSHQQGYDIKVENGTLTITAKVINLINAIAQNRVYDGTTGANVIADLDGVITGDDLDVALSGLFDNKNAGTGKDVTVTGSLTGADAGNYTLNGPVTTTADITAKVIDLINAVAQNREYNGTTDADVTAELDGVISGDDLQLAVNGAFDNKNAGTGKSVTVNGALSGADASNYTLSGPATATADITAKVIDLINAV